MSARRLTLMIGALLLAACAPKKSDVPLKGEAHLDRSDLDTMGNPMYIKVTNNDAFDWKDCIVLANLGLQAYRDLEPQADHIRHGDTVTLTLMKFQEGINGGGVSMDPRLILNLAIKCDTPNGQAVYTTVRP